MFSARARTSGMLQLANVCSFIITLCANVFVLNANVLKPLWPSGLGVGLWFWRLRVRIPPKYKFWMLAFEFLVTSTKMILHETLHAEFNKNMTWSTERVWDISPYSRGNYRTLTITRVPVKHNLIGSSVGIWEIKVSFLIPREATWSGKIWRPLTQVRKCGRISCYSRDEDCYFFIF